MTCPQCSPISLYTKHFHCLSNTEMLSHEVNDRIRFFGPLSIKCIGSVIGLSSVSDTSCDVQGIKKRKATACEEAEQILSYQFEPEYTQEEMLMEGEASGYGHGGDTDDEQKPA